MLFKHLRHYLQGKQDINKYIRNKRRSAIYSIYKEIVQQLKETLPEEEALTIAYLPEREQCLFGKGRTTYLKTSDSATSLPVIMTAVRLITYQSKGYLIATTERLSKGTAIFITQRNKR